MPASILIVRLSAIGDVVHALPVLEALRAQLPQARLGWIVEELSAPLLQGHPMLDHVYVVPKKRWRSSIATMAKEIRPFFSDVRSVPWEATLDLQGLSKSALAARASGASLRVGFAGPNAREISGFVNNRRVEPLPEDRHVVQQNLRLLEGLGLQVPAVAPRGTLGLRPEELDAQRERLTAAGWRGEPLFALNAGAGWVTKRWSPDFYGRLGVLLGERLGLRPLILWGPKEEPLRDAMAKAAPQAVVAPPTKLRELAAMLALCSLYAGGDTGASHLCGVLGVPVVTIFGASDPARNSPWPPTEQTGVPVQRTDLPCVPCWDTVCALKGEDHLRCLRSLTPEAVVERLEPWIARSGSLLRRS